VAIGLLMSRAKKRMVSLVIVIAVVKRLDGAARQLRQRLYRSPESGVSTMPKETMAPARAIVMFAAVREIVAPSSISL
jgi:hypothetical protein